MRGLVNKQIYNGDGDKKLELIFDSERVLYHGTTNLFADHIRKNGIKIYPRKFGADFGHGFYMTMGNENQALKWATIKSKNVGIPDKQLLEDMKMTVRDYISIAKELKPAILNTPTTYASLRGGGFLGTTAYQPFIDQAIPVCPTVQLARKPTSVSLPAKYSLRH
jgi:hypothetical protein